MRLSNEGLSALMLCFLTGSAVADTPPTIAIPATATPAVVTTKTTALSVLGADDLGETKLVYTWSTVGAPPATPTYNRNGNNAAKSVTATFNASGNYTFQVAIKDNAGQAVTSSVPVVVQ
ncbi:MAG: PKD domain-containing protein, partial [Kiritimatiellia bacterium]